MLDFLNNIGGIVVAVIASFTAFKLYNHKQQQTKKYEVYESILESFNKLNRQALQTRETCKDILSSEAYSSKHMSNIGLGMANSRNELVLKRHLVYLNTSPAFITEFKRFESKIEEIMSNWEDEIYEMRMNGYDAHEHLSNILIEASTMYEETERLITQTRNIVDHDLKKN